MNETLNTIINRRSIRAYKQTQIEDTELNEILKAGMYAPSACNEQPWHFTVIQNKNLIDNMSQEIKELIKQSENPGFRKMANNEKFHVLHNAPTSIIVSGDQNAMLPHIDCAAVTQNMLIAAESLGIGSCWVQFIIYLFEGEKGDAWKKELNIPEGYKPYYAIVLGYKNTQNPKAPSRKENCINFIK